MRVYLRDGSSVVVVVDDDVAGADAVDDGRRRDADLRGAAMASSRRVLMFECVKSRRRHLVLSRAPNGPRGVARNVA